MLSVGLSISVCVVCNVPFLKGLGFRFRVQGLGLSVCNVPLLEGVVVARFRV